MMVFPWRLMCRYIFLSLSSSPSWLLQALPLLWHASYSTASSRTESMLLYKKLIYPSSSSQLRMKEATYMYHCLYSLHSVLPQADSSQQLPPELPNRVWSCHHVHDYLFPHHPYHWPTWCGCTMHCGYIIDAVNLSPLLANLHCAP